MHKETSLFGNENSEWFKCTFADFVFSVLNQKNLRKHLEWTQSQKYTKII